MGGETEAQCIVWLILEKKEVTHGRWKNFHRKDHRGHPETPLSVFLRETTGKIRIVLEGRVDG